MPHVTVEYSANLDSSIDPAALCEAIRRAMLETGIFETGAVRVRAVRCQAYAIGDALAENAFVDIVLKVGAGRAVELRRRAGAAVNDAAAAHLAPVLETPHFALSVEVREIDPELSWKTNTMHARLRAS